MIQFSLNGEPVCCPPGLTVAAALFHLGQRVLRTTPRDARPRSLFCGMGICFDCVMEIDGQSGVRACCTRIQPGMEVVTQRGDARVGSSS